MGKAKSKYNTGVPISLEEMNEEEINQAMHEWAEGSENIENVLRESYKNNLLSHACCIGEGENHSVRPYMLFDLNTDKSRKIAVYLAQQLIESGLDCEIIFGNDFFLNDNLPEEYPTRNITDFQIETLVENREEVFGKMFGLLKEIEKVDLDSIEIPTVEEEVPTQVFKYKRLRESAVEATISNNIKSSEIRASDNNIEKVKDNSEKETDNQLDIED